ncbi:hypothetical protein AB0J86_04395 [Micromonospora sp. NPDC049559]|uniref:hypothetical protein n=1 Tax=Micromonospora sp. NPDC049559 TaxID=3155923 RepID=UPI003423A9EE
MFKNWLGRVGLTAVAAVAMIAGVGTPAFAGDTYLILSDIDGHQVGHMVHVDDGDTFRIYDDQADGYGPTGYLQVYAPAGPVTWVTLASKHNSSGAGHYVSFQYDVLEGIPYRMRLCHELVGCANQPFNE